MPENVLDEEGIKARFRYSLNCRSEANVPVQTQTIEQQITQQYFPHLKDNHQPQLSSPPSEQTFVRVSVIKRIQPELPTIKTELEEDDQEVKVIIEEEPKEHQLRECSQTTVSKSDEESYQSLIKKYVHKKFNKSLYNEQHDRSQISKEEYVSQSVSLMDIVKPKSKSKSKSSQVQRQA